MMRGSGSGEHVITAVRGYQLRAMPPAGTEDDDDPSLEALIVAIETASGHVGLGECNHHAAAAHAFLAQGGGFRTGQGVAAALLGRDPRDTTLLADLTAANRFSARRGIGWGVIAAVDTALWDLRARIAGVPLWRLLWGDAARPCEAYYTIYTGAADWSRTQKRLAQFCADVAPLGFGTVKIEPLVDCVPEAEIGAFAVQARALVGAEMGLIVDFGYRMPDAVRALAAIAACAPARPLMIETPCDIDRLDVWHAVATASPIPIAGAELLDHAADYTQLLDAGVQVAQPWPNRVGVTGTMAVIAEAAARGRRTVLAGWNATAVGVAAGVHLGAGIAGEGAVVEYASRALYGFALRAATGPEPVPVAGRFALPDSPGLGVLLDMATLAPLLAAPVSG